MRTLVERDLNTTENKEYIIEIFNDFFKNIGDLQEELCTDVNSYNTMGFILTPIRELADCIKLDNVEILWKPNKKSYNTNTTLKEDRKSTRLNSSH